MKGTPQGSTCLCSSWQLLVQCQELWASRSNPTGGCTTVMCQCTAQSHTYKHAITDLNVMVPQQALLSLHSILLELQVCPQCKAQHLSQCHDCYLKHSYSLCLHTFWIQGVRNWNSEHVEKGWCAYEDGNIENINIPHCLAGLTDGHTIIFTSLCTWLGGLTLTHPIKLLAD